MEIISYVLNTLNITIVYNNLDRDHISRDKIRKIIQEKPLINDLPDVLIVVYQENNIQAIFDQRRIVINATNKSQINIDNLFSLITKIARGMIESVETYDISAYGFNFTGICKVDLEEDITEYFKENFFKIPERLLESFGGEVMKVSPRFSIKNEKYEFNISLEPTDKNDEFIFHLNSHFNTDSLPSLEDMNNKLNSSYVLFRQLMEKM